MAAVKACHTGRNLVYQEKNITKKTRVFQALLWLKTHITDHVGIKQAKCYNKKFSRSGLGEPKRAG